MYSDFATLFLHGGVHALDPQKMQKLVSSTSQKQRSSLLNVLSGAPMCKTNLTKYGHAYSCVQTYTNDYGRVRTMFWAIVDRTTMKISLYRVVVRLEFDGAIRFCLAPPKSMFLQIFIDFLDVSRNLFVFEFSKKPGFFSRAVAKPRTLPTAAAAAAAAVALQHFVRALS